jgi:hypothetical protein
MKERSILTGQLGRAVKEEEGAHVIDHFIEPLHSRSHY